MPKGQGFIGQRAPGTETLERIANNPVQDQPFPLAGESGDGVTFRIDHYDGWPGAHSPGAPDRHILIDYHRMAYLHPPNGIPYALDFTFCVGLGRVNTNNGKGFGGVLGVIVDTQSAQRNLSSSSSDVRH